MNFLDPVPNNSGDDSIPDTLWRWLKKVWLWAKGEVNVSPWTTVGTLVPSDDYYYPISRTGSNVTVTLPLCVNKPSKKYLFKNIATGSVVTINCQSVDTIDGAASVVLSEQFQSIELVSDGTNLWSIIGTGTGGMINMGTRPGGRLTLTSGDPVGVNNVTGATTVYYTPYVSNRIELWDGTSWINLAFTEKTLALGTLTSNQCYDVFAFSSGTSVALAKVAWTNNTTRATAVTLQDGRYCLSGDKTQLYLGTFLTTSTTTTEDSGGAGVSQTGGHRYLWNMYNRVLKWNLVLDTTGAWAYTTQTWRQANAAAGNKVEFVIGLQEDAIFVETNAGVQQVSGASFPCMVSVGIDSITVPGLTIAQLFNLGTVSTLRTYLHASFNRTVAPGYHYAAWLEYGGDGTVFFVGSSQAGQSGLQMSHLC